jgi:hypothetical protein
MEIQTPLKLEDHVIQIENLQEIDNYKIEFTCVICLGIVIKPMQLRCCDHLICTGCLKKYIRSTIQTPKCPLCKHSLIYGVPNKFIMRLYMNLKINCLYKNEGCEIITTSERYFQHIFNECSYNSADTTSSYKYCKVCEDIYLENSSHDCPSLINMKEVKEAK